jgi:phage gp29-like protein
MALNVENPSRQRLYDVYRDCEIDSHLTGCFGQIKGYVNARSFSLVKKDKKGEEDVDATELLNAVWFKDLVNHALDAKFWGHSLIQLGDPCINEDGKRMYDGVTLIPRKHVVPEYGYVTNTAGDDWHGGVNYRQPPFSDWLIEVGGPHDLGLLLKAAPHTIPKKNMLAFWDQFGEVFGMPMRIAKTTVRDKGERSKIEKMLDHMGASFWALFQEGTDIEIKESTRGDAFNVYDKRIDKCDAQLSKLILHQTMTIENGSSLSQSETHLDVLKNLIEEYADGIRDMVNNQLLPKMAKHGFPVAGLRFDWNYERDYTPEQQVAFETMITDRYEVPKEYFENKYGIPISGEKKSQLRKPEGFFD